MEKWRFKKILHKKMKHNFILEEENEKIFIVNFNRITNFDSWMQF